MSVNVVTVVLAAGAAAAAAAGVRFGARTDRARGLWWVAGLAAATGAVVGSGGPVRVAAAASAAGLAAGAVVDVVEGRIPIAVAHGATAASLLLVIGHGLGTGDPAGAALAVGLSALFVACLGLLWLAGLIGFGDVRLAGATVTAMVPGVAGLVVLALAAFAAAGAFAVVRRLSGARGRVPFAGPLALGWLVSLAVS